MIDIAELEKLAESLTRYKVNAYVYSPSGYHEKDFAVSFDGRRRIIERVPEELAQDISNIINLGAQVPALCEELKSLRECKRDALEIAKYVLALSPANDEAQKFLEKYKERE